MERVVAALLERYSGRLPLWLAPVQVCVLPVGPAQDSYARALVDDLCAAGLRPRLDTDGSLGARIRNSRERRDALIAVVGADEAGSDSVHVTDPAADFAGRVARDKFLASVRDARSSRARQCAWPAEPR
jgi:threonyl-tRNA synthetase